MSDWQPVKTEDLVRLYREGWTLKLNDRLWTISKRKNSDQTLAVALFDHENWEGKPPESRWEVVETGMSFLAAVYWLESSRDGLRRIRLAGDKDQIVARNGGPRWLDVATGNADAFVVFGLRLTTATSWEGLEEVQQ